MRRQPSVNQEKSPHQTLSANALMLNFPASRTRRNEVLLPKPPVDSNLLLKPKVTKTMMQGLLQDRHKTSPSHLSPEEQKLLSLGGKLMVTISH